MTASDPFAPVPSPGSPGLVPAPVSTEDRNLGMLCHLMGLCALIGPVGGILGPLAVWLTQRHSSAYADYHGKEAVNFQITMALAVLICLAAFFLIIPIFVAIAIGIFSLVMSVIASIRASDGKYYRYPFTIRFLK